MVDFEDVLNIGENGHERNRVDEKGIRSLEGLFYKASLILRIPSVDNGMSEINDGISVNDNWHVFRKKLNRLLEKMPPHFNSLYSLIS